MKQQKTAGIYIDHRPNFIIDENIEMTKSLDALLDLVEIYYLPTHNPVFSNASLIDVSTCYQNHSSVVYDFFPREQPETLWNVGTFVTAIQKGIIIPAFGYESSKRGGNGERARFDLTQSSLKRQIHNLSEFPRGVTLNLYFHPKK